MDTELRLECLKLVYRLDRQPAANIADARELEKFILEGTQTEPEKKQAPEKPKKKGGNPDFLS